MAEAEALLGPGGVLDMAKVRALVLELGDAFAEAAKGLCEDGKPRKRHHRCCSLPPSFFAFPTY